MGNRMRIDPESDALIVVDVQKDFCPGGALAVPQGDEVVPVLNRWLAVGGLLKVATRDWHPPTHCSFRGQGGLWPPHCLRGTPGAEFQADLDTAAINLVVSKATEPEQEAYSGFDAPELPGALRAHAISRLWVGGLVTDYCVKATVLDGLRRGFQVYVIEDAVRGIDAEPGDCGAARGEMERAGARFVRSDQVLVG